MGPRSPPGKKNRRKSTTQHAPSVFHFDLLLTLYLSRFPLKIEGGGRKKFFSNPPKPRVLGGSEIDSTGQPPLPRNRKTRPSHRRNRNFPAECQRTNPTDNLGWIFGQTFGSVPRDPIFLWLFISLLFFFRRVNCCGHHHRPPIKLSSVLSTFPRVFGWPASWRVCVVRKPSLELGLRNFTLCYKFGQ